MTRKYGVSEAQLLLKWALQHRLPVLPKSSKAARIGENAQLFHFSIDEGDMATLDGLDQNLALAWPVGNPLDWE
jgi:2,5-diketo-D-gluconate reductase A